jgi:hypothetical protein
MRDIFIYIDSTWILLENLNLNQSLLSIFFAFVLIASSLSVARPAQSQQQQPSTDDVLRDIQRGMPPLTQPSQAPPPQQQQQPQQWQDIGNDFVKRFNRQIYPSGQQPPSQQLQQPQQGIGVGQQQPFRIKITPINIREYQITAITLQGLFVRSSFKLIPNVQYQITDQDLQRMDAIGTKTPAFNIRKNTVISSQAIGTQLRFNIPYMALPKGTIQALQSSPVQRTSLSSSSSTLQQVQPHTVMEQLAFSPASFSGNHIMIKPVQMQSSPNQAVSILMLTGISSEYFELERICEQEEKIQYLGLRF